MLIILEGCDGVGKSTIAAQLAKLLNAEIVHCTRETPNDYEFFSGIIEASENRNVIADRFCYGQFVYQKPEERKLTPRDLTRLEIEILASNAKVVHVIAPVPEIRERLKNRGEQTDTPVSEICQKFTEVFEKSLTNPILWWTGGEI
jgi:thymidylate kinase